MIVEKVMLIEDNKSERFFFKNALEEINPNIELIVARNCTDAIIRLCTLIVVPQFIFLESHMPGMDSFECLSSLMEYNKLKNIPIIIYSGSEDPKDSIRFLEEGAAYFMHKVNNIDELPAAIMDTIQRVSLKSTHGN